MATLSYNHNCTTPPGHESSGSELDFCEPERVFALAYAILPAKLNAFKEFYKRDIHKWMKKRQVKHAQAILVDNILVVLTTSEANVPWITGPLAIPKLKEYLATKRPINVRKLSTFPDK
jgi:hypothetical protein